ncbi:hypothetical protein E2C01_093781 [Portunus trituberculatus]|uniref:Uncharacterized protein n=1 Tax=Portunus trituberculatus TaxID=210409 RepID=A0A5B7JK16_PORTR|nr:hypothetical protein [Portunus trituberculatus]
MKRSCNRRHQLSRCTIHGGIGPCLATSSALTTRCHPEGHAASSTEELEPASHQLCHPGREDALLRINCLTNVLSFREREKTTSLHLPRRSWTLPRTSCPGNVVPSREGGQTTSLPLTKPNQYVLPITCDVSSI